MRSTIDSGGRVVIPKELREKLGLGAGSQIEIVEDDGQVVLRPRAIDVELVDTPHGVVARSADETPVLDADTVRRTLERSRR